MAKWLHCWEIDLSFIKGGTLCQNLQNLETVMPRLSSLSLAVKKKKKTWVRKSEKSFELE